MNLSDYVKVEEMVRHKPCGYLLASNESEQEHYEYVCPFRPKKDAGTLPSPALDTVRTFDTGANRDTDDGKLDFEGFNSPLVDLEYAKYMHENRRLKDGTLRDSDNWQKGIPGDEYLKSLMRHLHDLRLHHRGYGHLAREEKNKALCGILFNAKGYLFEILKEQ